MSSLELFPRHGVVGIFRGFREGGLEFHAELVLPYRSDFHSIPMHGQFILVQLESPDEAVLGRIASFSSEGKLASGYGEEFNLRAMRDERPVPDDLREEYLKYKVDIRVLGVVRISADDPDDVTFVPSHRRLPHVGSLVAFPSDKVLQKIVGEVEEGAEIGHFALGEYIYSHGRKDVQIKDWMQVKSPEVSIRFPIENLVSRRSFIFARAGFGKSNLNKLLFSKLYEQTPTVEKRNGSKIPVGTILFDPDGEYFWPDDKNRPGLCDVPALQDKLVVFTSRKGPGPFYNSFVAGGIKLDIRRLNPSDVISIALSAERQEQQNVRKLRGLDQRSWEKLVNLIDAEGNQAPVREISKILQLEENKQEVEALAARSNMTNIVRTLHDKSSQLMDMLISALSQGKLCIVDVSQMRGPQALILSGLILRRIFDRNQEEFTKANPRTIPTIAVVEEAQSVLNERSTAAEPYIAWVKEGRKYDLGALLITQQPGSIPTDILSQGDNWFIFHLLSSTDLINLQRANAHFSNDILSVLLNEPIPGQGIFWSSASKRAYPIPIRVLSFEHMYSAIDPEYNKPAADTFARRLKEKFQRTLEESIEQHSVSSISSTSEGETFADNVAEAEPIDAKAVYENKAIEKLRENQDFMEQVQGKGIPWGVILGFLADELPDTIENRRDVANYLVREALERFFGMENKAWHTFKRPNRENRQIIWVKAGKAN
jgi:Helicase HerA, central domain